MDAFGLLSLDDLSIECWGAALLDSLALDRDVAADAPPFRLLFLGLEGCTGEGERLDDEEEDSGEGEDDFRRLLLPLDVSLSAGASSS